MRLKQSFFFTSSGSRDCIAKLSPKMQELNFSTVGLTVFETSVSEIYDINESCHVTLGHYLARRSSDNCQYNCSISEIRLVSKTVLNSNACKF